MRIIDTDFSGLKVIELTVHQDQRGFFAETFRRDIFAAAGLPHEFVQANHARSNTAGVLRGLHFQTPPAAQAKLVWVTAGEVLDVVVDIRKGSPTFGRHFSIRLSADNFARLLIPRGFAHGYLTLTAPAEFQYMVDGYYAPELEGGLLWDDPDLGIDWGMTAPLLSEKDTRLPPFRELDSPFVYEPPGNPA